MDVEEIEEHFKEIGEEPFIFLDKKMKITSYKFDEEKILIYTDLDTFPIIRRKDDIEEFFTKIQNGNTEDEEETDYMTDTEREAFLPDKKTKASLTPNKNKSMPIQQLTDLLRDVLIADIDKLKTNRDYIGQAKARNNNVNSLINLAKLQLEMQTRK